MKILSSFTHPQVVPNLYEFLSSAERGHDMDFFKMILIRSLRFTDNVKGLVHPKMKMILLFTHPQAILGVYDFLLSDKSNQSYIKNCPGSSKLYHCSQRVFLLHSPKHVK